MTRELLIVTLFLMPWAGHAQDAKTKNPVEVTRVSQPEKALKFEVVVSATPAEVWQAFTTTEGLDTWLWRDCSVDLREGGEWLVHFPGGKDGGGTIVSFRDRKQLVVHAMAPEQFPEVRKVGTTAIFDFTPDGERTRVTLTQTGWRAGKEWDEAYEYLATGNAQLLAQLHLRFAHGPLRWE